MLGFDLTELDGKHYSSSVLEGGSAEQAGLLRGDRIVSIDGVEVTESSRLDWRTDDAYLPDPPHRFCLCQEGEVVHLKIERRPGVYLDLDVECQLYSSFEASRASARIIERDGKRIGYLHLWLIYLTGVDTLLKDRLEGSFADCDALVLDLRGRGGSGFMVPRLLDILDGTSSSWIGPVVGLTDRGSRSAKDVIAYEFRNRNIGRLVGQTTAGAVIPVTLEDVGHETHLMFPSFKLSDHTDRLEFAGVPPHVVVEQALAYTAGEDPILEAGLREAVRLAELKAQSNPSSVAEVTVPRLLTRMVNAVGGEEALLAHSSRTLVGTIKVGDMGEGTLTSLAAAPDYLLTTVEMGGVGTQKYGFDGRTGWRDGLMGQATLVKGDELVRMRNRADFYGLLNYKKNYPTIKLLEDTDFAGKRCYTLELTDASGSVEFLYVDPQSYLVAGKKSTRATPMGELEVTSVYEQYKEFDGVTLCIRMRQDVGGMQEQIITISEVSHRPHHPTVFKLPNKIQELVRAETPAAAELLEKMIDALGGEEALRKHATRTDIGVLRIGNMMEGTFTAHSAAPDYSSSTVELTGMGVHREGFNGEVAWRDSPQSGAQILEGPESTKMRNRADFFGVLNYEENYTLEVSLGHTSFAGRECIELKLTDASGSVENVYIDPQTYLAAGSIATEKGPMGEIEVTSVIEEYGTFDGMKTPIRIKNDIGGMMEQTLTIANVSFDPIPEGTFDLPDSIRKLLDEQKSEGG